MNLDTSLIYQLNPYKAAEVFRSIGADYEVSEIGLGLGTKSSRGCFFAGTKGERLTLKLSAAGRDCIAVK
jgi:hypothetical protein